MWIGGVLVVLLAAVLGAVWSVYSDLKPRDRTPPPAPIPPPTTNEGVWPPAPRPQGED